MPGDHSLVKSDDPQHPANLIPEWVVWALKGKKINFCYYALPYLLTGYVDYSILLVG